MHLQIWNINDRPISAEVGVSSGIAVRGEIYVRLKSFPKKQKYSLYILLFDLFLLKNVKV